MVNKNGSEKYYIVISLILGLMVLALSLYFIFGEYFTEDQLDWQQCRQSVILRTNLPKATLLGLETDLKGAFPLKCKTEVVTIDSAEKSAEVYGKVAEAVAEGWYMFGEGKFDFIHRDFTKDQTLCLVFARIHFTQDAIDDILENNWWSKEFVGKKGATTLEKMDWGFYDYYKSTKVPGTNFLYDEYLPMPGGSTDKNGNLFVYWANVSFIPPAGEDLLLVYQMRKFDSVASSPWNNWLTNGVANVVVAFSRGTLQAPTRDELAAMENYRPVILTTSNALGEIGCTKFLTIPA